MGILLLLLLLLLMLFRLGIGVVLGYRRGDILRLRHG